MSASLQLVEYTGHLSTSSVLIHAHDKPRERDVRDYVFSLALAGTACREERVHHGVADARARLRRVRGADVMPSILDRFRGRSSRTSNIRMSCVVQETPKGMAYLQESSTECRATLRQGRGSGPAHYSSINAKIRARQHRGLKAGWKRGHYPFIALLAMHGSILRKAEGE